MNLFPILSVVGTLLMVLGGAQFIPMFLALGLGEQSWVSFLYSALGSMGVGGVLFFSGRGRGEIAEKEGFSVVTLGWVFAALSGAIPYYLSGATPSFTDGFFESMSGFTTTGASIFPSYAFPSLGQGILLWRSMTQWFGGMGIIVLALVILPALGIGGMQLYKREVPGPTSEKLTPRLRDTAQVLWGVYLILTVVVSLVLFALGMSPLEAINHALTTVSTGGFSTSASSVGGFNSAGIEWALTIFMLMGGTNVALHYRFLFHRSKKGSYFKDEEWLWYIAVFLGAFLAVSLFLKIHHGYPVFEALTKSAFQVASILSTTGFGSDDYGAWGTFPQLLLLILMVMGGCAGSTSGGVKLVRVVLLFKYMRLEMIKLIHPRAVIHARLGTQRVEIGVLGNIVGFFFLYLTTVAVITLLVSLDGHSLATSIGAAVSAVGNIGPGLGQVGPASHYGGLSDYVKWVLMMGMLLGRLELMTVMVLIFPQTWRR